MSSITTAKALQEAQAESKHLGFVLAFVDITDEEVTPMVTELTTELEQEFTGLKFITINTQDKGELITVFNVKSSPTFITVLDEKTLEHIQGIDAPAVYSAVEELNKKAELYKKIYGLINQDKWVLFMKGTRETPKCGFSRKMCDLLASVGIESYSTFNILEDQEVRDTIKVYSSWPTFPQLYNNGELLGGLDVITAMAADGELEELK
jgi:Grx4 family monothiol glutaredoxin